MDNDDFSLARAACEAFVLDYCNVEELPLRLLEMVDIMARDFVKCGILSNDRLMKSLKMGNVSATMSDESSVNQFFNKYKLLLVPYRQMRW